MASDRNTVRALSRRYAAGDIDRDSYRLQRRALIEAIVAGRQELAEFTVPAPETPTVFPYEDDEGDTTQEIIPNVAPVAAAARAGRAGRTRLLLALAVVATLAVAGGTWWLARPVVPVAAPPAAAPTAELPPDPVDRFLAVNVWTSESLDAFIAEWQALDDGEREAFVDDGALRRLGDAVLAQVAAESALMELGDPRDSLDAQQRLLDFADAMAIDDARLARARREWQAAREEHLAPAADEALESSDEAAPTTPSLPAAAAPGAALTPPAPATGSDKPAGPRATAAAGDVAERPADADSAPETSRAPPLEPRRALAKTVPATATQPSGADARTPPATAAPAAALASTATAPVARTPPDAAAPERRTSCRRALARTRQPYCLDLVAPDFKGPALVVLPTGSFAMGGDGAHEGPVHEVTIGYTIAASMFEISAQDLARYCDSAGRACPRQPWNDADMPAVNVTWQFAQDYAAWLSELTGATYRLPSEAEWEYAARGGVNAVYPSGRDDILPTDARFSYQSEETTPLAANDRSINKNPFRLYHMAGNVREWVQDTWADDYAGAPRDGSARSVPGVTRHVVRGGSYADGADALRSAARTALEADGSDDRTGFRVVRVVEN